jgi:crotonobetainyl-CoA:carnitine CoA-transferase CaiB-like acyl-CoA transferase
VRLDFDTDDGREQLGQLVRTADVVIEASRPRALRELGIPAERIMGDGRRRVWVRITGHGQNQNRIAFGDDAAVAGGLVAWDRLGPVFAGDAIADPLTGVLAALAARACADAGGAWTVDLALADVARYAASL